MESSRRRGRGPRGLCVDDEPFVVEGLSHQLERHFDVRVATSGKAALEIMSTEKEFAVVISDMQMPEMNGADFLELVKKRWPQTLRILLTGHADMEAAAQAVNKGDLFRFLLKPCAATDLRQAIEEACEKRRHAEAERDF